MKSVTEFPTFKLVQGLTAKTALAAEGKTPEEVEASLGEKFKLEGEKLKYFVNAMEVAGQNLEKLSRVIVVTLSEGENVPMKAVKTEEHYYVPEFQKEASKTVANIKDMKTSSGDKKGKGGGKGPKPSPWGISPEEKAAKKAAAAKSAAEATAAAKK